MKKLKQRTWKLKQLATDPTVLEMYIYGDVEAGGYDWWTDQEIVSETSANFFRDELSKYPDVKSINLYVNSFGGSVFEAMAIRNQLKRSPATVTGIVDGFAASAASFILTACDTVKMYSNTTQMLHNMWNVVAGNATQLRKAADDMDVMMEGNKQAYLEKANGKLTAEKITEVLDGETWLTAAQCLEIGLCDEVIAENVDLTAAKELVQKMNETFEQKINYSKKLSAQLKELVAESIKVNPEEVVDEPIVQTNAEKLMAAFKIKNVEVK